MRGRAYRQVLAVAEDEGADLIVMGVQGRNALNRFLFGSTTHHVTARSALSCDDGSRMTTTPCPSERQHAGVTSTRLRDEPTPLQADRVSQLRK